MEPLQFDLTLIQARGGNLCGDDRFTIVACAQCGTHYLYNEELRDIYYNPFDLSRRFFNIEMLGLPPCVGCGLIDWRFSASNPIKVEVQLGPWAWVLKQ